MRRSCAPAAAALLLGAAVLPHPAAADAVETTGDILRVALPATAIALTVRRHDRDGRRQFYRSFAANVGATWLLKEAVDKERPDGSDDNAFPSGHTSTAFQSAAFIHRRYGIRSAWPAYVLAGVTGWTRIDADQHDGADVLAGAALGVATSFWLTDPFEPGQISFSPVVGDDVWAVTISGTF